MNDKGPSLESRHSKRSRQERAINLEAKQAPGSGSKREILITQTMEGTTNIQIRQLSIGFGVPALDSPFRERSRKQQTPEQKSRAKPVRPQVVLSQ